MIVTIQDVTEQDVEVRVRELSGMYPLRYFAFAGPTRVEAIQHLATWLTVVAAENPELEVNSIALDAFEDGDYEVCVTVSFAGIGELS